MSLEAGDERSRLLPVLHTMLKFTDEELSRLRAIAASGMQSKIMQLGRIKGGLGWEGGISNIYSDIIFGIYRDRFSS